MEADVNVVECEHTMWCSASGTIGHPPANIGLLQAVPAQVMPNPVSASTTAYREAAAALGSSGMPYRRQQEAGCLLSTTLQAAKAVNAPYCRGAVTAP